MGVIAGRAVAQTLHPSNRRTPTRSRSVVDSRAKRTLDLALAAGGLLMLAPALTLLGIAVIVDSGWPPLYSQRRLGLNGRPFRLWKLRTMVRDAHQLRDSLLERNERPFPAFKMRRDPRTTRIGRFLRRSSLDELPQLWNVLKGEMSLVGPRPPLPEEVKHYDDQAMRRLAARPGITCIWQVENRQGGGDLLFNDWVRQDLAYIENWDLRLDLVLLARTLRAVARMTGQ